MMPAQSRVDAGIWTVPGQPHFIEYSRSVLNEIILHVVEAYDSYLAGGYEVGGVLFGYHEGFHLRIQAFRPIDIKPPRPSFVLSEKDEAHLAGMLDAARSDPSLEGMEPIGWYHSHTRSEIFLSEADLEIYSRNFPEPYQVAMVLHPSEHEPVRVGFFFRETDGFIRSDQSYQEFAVDVPPRNPSFRKSPPWKVDFHGHPVEPEPGSEPAALEPVEPEEYALAPEPQKATLPQRLGTWGLLTLAAIAIGASIYTITALRRPDAGLGLRVSAAGGELVVQWDPNNQAISAADHLELLIRDGSRQSTIPISHKTLKEPVYVYKPASLRVDLLLKAGGSWFGNGKQESTTFLAHPSINQPPAELVGIKRDIAQAETETAELRTSLDEEVAKARNLEARIEAINQKRMEAEKLAEAKKQEQAARRLAGFRPPAAKPAAAPKELPAAPEFASRPAVTGVAPPSAAFPSRTLDPPPPPPRPAAVAASVPPSVPPVTARPAAPVATSGRIIWTGELPRDAVLTIDGRKASKGSLSGELPGGLVRVGAYPAELTTDGLRILTGNPRYTQPRVEPPSAANGWQKTQYVYDPKAIRDLIVEQMPAQTSPKQLTLRGGSRKLSVIVIEWQLATP